MNELTYRVPAAEMEAFSSIGDDHRMEIRAMLDVFYAVDHSPRGARLGTWDIAIRTANASLEAAGLKTRFSRQTLYGIRAAFKAAGDDWTECIDLRKVSDWSRTERRRRDEVPAATALWFKQMVEMFKGRNLCLQQAHRRAVETWRLGHSIPGYDALPPSGPDGLPAGWSYSNFCCLCKRTKMVKVRAITGAKAATRFAFHVPTTRVGLSVGQFYMLDDQWHDFTVKKTPKSPPMRLFELCSIDLFSGKKVCYGLKPESIDDETGARVRLQGRDMRFMLAALLHLHGYRPQGTTLIGELGTAVVPEDIQQVLRDASDGAIKFEASGIRDTPAFPGWYRARGGGNPNFKAALESSFNLTRNATGILTGQTGSNERVNAPEELFGRKEADKALVRAISNLPLTMEQQLSIRAPFMLASQAAKLLHCIYQFLDDRTQHDLEGWETAGLVTGEVRVDPRNPLWTPLYALAAATQEQQSAMAAIMQIPGCYRIRRFSPAEVWRRDCGGLARIPAHVLPMIIGRDLAEERRVNDHGSFLFQEMAVSHEPLRYVGVAVNPRGHEVMLKEGETYLTFCNPFDLRYLLVCDSRLGYIGRCERVEGVCRADQDRLTEAMGQAAHANALRSRAFLARNAGFAEQRAEDDLANAAMLAAASPAGVVQRQQEDCKAASDRRANAGDLNDIYGNGHDGQEGGEVVGQSVIDRVGDLY